MTAPAGVFPYAPLVVRQYLLSVLPNDDNELWVSTEVPADRSKKKLVTITTAPTGGGDNIALQPRRLIIHCYHADELQAGILAETVLGHLRSAPYTNSVWDGDTLVRPSIRAVTVVGTPALFPDPDDSTPRVQLTVDVLLRATYN